MDRNLEVYNQYTHEYRDYSLYPPERVILQRFKAQWSSMRVLDIGIGTGRTSYTFAAISGQYVGIDYAEAMVRESLAVIPASDGASLRHCDARDLSDYYDEKFDFVMFSLNGLDSVGHGDRELILREVRKVLAPRGYFFFSTHTLNGFSIDRPLPAWRPSSPLGSTYYLAQALRNRLRMRWTHRRTSLEQVRKQQWAVLKTGDHDFKIDIYHVDPAYQLRELARLGFRADIVLDPRGRVVDALQAKADWLYFLCQPDTV